MHSITAAPLPGLDGEQGSKRPPLVRVLVHPDPAGGADPSPAPDNARLLPFIPSPIWGVCNLALAPGQADSRSLHHDTMTAGLAMTVYSYTRVSTGRQAEEGESLGAQQRRMVGYQRKLATAR